MAQAENLETSELDASHYAESSAREKLVEHVFLGELLQALWRKNIRDLEVLRPEVDSGGYSPRHQTNHRRRPLRRRHAPLCGS